MADTNFSIRLGKYLYLPPLSSSSQAQNKVFPISIRSETEYNFVLFFKAYLDTYVLKMRYYSYILTFFIQIIQIIQIKSRAFDNQEGKK